MVRTVGKLSPGITSADLLPYRPAPGPPPEWPPVNAPKQPLCGPNLREKQAPKRHPAGSAPLWAPRWLGFDVTLRRVGRYRDPAPVLKTGVSERAPWVRIPPSPLPGVLRMPCVLTKIARFPERMSPTSSHHRRPDEIRFPAEAAQLAGSAKLRACGLPGEPATERCKTWIGITSKRLSSIAQGCRTAATLGLRPHWRRSPEGARLTVAR
jgi:hypothetical protein